MESAKNNNEEKEIANRFEKLELSSFLIDAHLHFQYFTNEEVKNIVEKCYNNSEIRYFITNATCFDDFERTINLSGFKIDDKIAELNKDYDLNQIIFSGIGHHPWYLENIADNWLETFEKKIIDLEEKKCNFFIGEIGIDGGKPKK